MSSRKSGCFFRFRSNIMAKKNKTNRISPNEVDLRNITLKNLDTGKYVEMKKGNKELKHVTRALNRTNSYYRPAVRGTAQFAAYNHPISNLLTEDLKKKSQVRKVKRQAYKAGVKAGYKYGKEYSKHLRTGEGKKNYKEFKKQVGRRNAVPIKYFYKERLSSGEAGATVTKYLHNSYKQRQRQRTASARGVASASFSR